MGHSSIQVTVDIYHHYVQGSNKQAVDRLDETVDNSKTEVESATIRNRGEAAQGGEERFQSETIEKTGAGDLDRTGDLRFTNGDGQGYLTLGDAKGFPVFLFVSGS